MLRRCKGSGRAVTAVRGYYQPSVAWNNCSTMPYRCMNIYSISLCWFWEHWHFDFGLSRTGLIIFLRLCNCVLPLKATELRATWFGSVRVEHPIIILRRGNIGSDLSVWHMPPILQVIWHINHRQLCCFRARTCMFSWRNGAAARTVTRLCHFTSQGQWLWMVI